jgi:transposase
MPIPYQLSLTITQRAELLQTRNHAPKPYLRERAAVLLKIASGHSLQEAARSGGLKPHHPDTICAWVHRYEQAGLDGLRIRAGRGRKPAFSPSAS